MSDTDNSPARDNSEPFTGDRGWNGLEKTKGEVGAFLIVVALLVVAVLMGLTLGLKGIGLVFVLLAFVGLAMLMLISVGQ